MSAASSPEAGVRAAADPHPENELLTALVGGVAAALLLRLIGHLRGTR